MIEKTEQWPFKLLRNRVYRTYQGGKLLEHWQGLAAPTDGLQPEEWVASMVEARNSNVVPGEGLSRIDIAGEEIGLTEIVRTNPAYYLGDLHVTAIGSTLGVLTKVLDSAVRLSIQVHPTKSFSRKFFNSEYGKTEAWYIIGGRKINGEKPYVLIGFKEGVSKSQWQIYFEKQDINSMIGAMHKFEVEPGDVILIEGGLAHAIGSGCFLIEIQEPTDFTMRVEMTAFDGGIISDDMCHQGLGFETMLDCFDYSALSFNDTYKKCFKKPELLFRENGNCRLSLISGKDTLCFSMDKIVVVDKLSINEYRFKICIVLSGKGTLKFHCGQITIEQGEMYFLPVYLTEIEFINDEPVKLECILCYAPQPTI